ncbi:hypothetical protein WJX73_005797 [Symbiochloris irregularis]|uniref:DUF4200 domain-containing protein n=1 Tax=Symbiochloris irregularis TaxID=706552 RepID=A0AAW1NPN8_9CHLO
MAQVVSKSATPKGVTDVLNSTGPDESDKLISPAARLLEKRREIFRLQNELDEHKLKIQDKEADFQRRELLLKQRDIELQESLVRFSKFLQESDAKMARATKTAAEERRLREEKTREVEALNVGIGALHQQRRQIQSDVKKYIKFKDFLEDVLEVTRSFSTVEDLLARHATLESANNDLRQQQWRAADLTEKTGEQAQLFIKSKADEILHDNNNIALLKQELKIYQQEAYSLEAQKDSVMQAAAERTRDIGQVCLSIDGLYQRCRMPSQPNASSITEQLDVIGNRISDLATIVREARLRTVGESARDLRRTNSSKSAASVAVH